MTSAGQNDEAEERRSERETWERVLVCHAFGRSGDVICRVLAEHGFNSEGRTDIASLTEGVSEGAGAVVIGDNVLTDDFTLLRVALDGQDSWSDIPIVVLVGAGQGPGAIDVELFGGRLQIRTKPGTGTRVRLDLPQPLQYDP